MKGQHGNHGARRKRPLVWRIVSRVLLGYAALVVVAFLLQRRLQYFPDRSDPDPPKGPRFRGLESVDLVAADGVRLRAWYWPGGRGQTVVVFHGNAGNRLHRAEWLEPLHNAGFGLFVLDYRGYGGSAGRPTERGLYRDGDAAIAWLEKHDAGSLIYMGESLGCGVAIEMAVRKTPAKLILQSGYTSMAEVGQHAYPFLPVKWLMKDRYECRSKIGRITCPVLMIHGQRDSIIPPQFGRRLFEAAPEPKQWFPLPGVGHNDVPDGVGYYERLLAFLER